MSQINKQTKTVTHRYIVFHSQSALLGTPYTLTSCRQGQHMSHQRCMFLPRMNCSLHHDRCSWEDAGRWSCRSGQLMQKKTKYTEFMKPQISFENDNFVPLKIKCSNNVITYFLSCFSKNYGIQGFVLFNVYLDSKKVRILLEAVLANINQ